MNSILSISKGANIAIHTLMYMANHPTDTYTNSKALAKELKVSETHLAKVMQKLVHKKYVKSIRGATGGFIIVANPAKINILDVIESIDGPMPQDQCLLGEAICDIDECLFIDIQRKIYKLLTKELSEKTIAQLLCCDDKVDKKKVKK